MRQRFQTPAFVALLRKFNPLMVFAERAVYPAHRRFFIYTRLQRGNEKLKADYAPKALNFWVAQANTWALGGEPADLPRIAKARAKPASRDVFAYFIYEAKLRAPAMRGAGTSAIA